MILPLFFLSMASALAQSVQVQGKVTDEKGTELPGVTVLLKGTTTATPTGADGTYSLDIPDGSGTLVFSYVGYQPQEVPINNQSTVNVKLLDDAKALQEVVVVGYGTQKRENLTGAVSTVSSEAIQNRPVSNVATALQGVAPGLNITRTTGQPGNEGIGIQIRGATSANGNVDPLIVVDGVASPGVTLQTLNPNDIAPLVSLKMRLPHLFMVPRLPEGLF